MHAVLIDRLLHLHPSTASALHFCRVAGYFFHICASFVTSCMLSASALKGLAGSGRLGLSVGERDPLRHSVPAATPSACPAPFTPVAAHTLVRTAAAARLALKACRALLLGRPVHWAIVLARLTSSVRPLPAAAQQPAVCSAVGHLSGRLAASAAGVAPAARRHSARGDGCAAPAPPSCAHVMNVKSCQVSLLVTGQLTKTCRLVSLRTPEYSTLAGRAKIPSHRAISILKTVAGQHSIAAGSAGQLHPLRQYSLCHQHLLCSITIMRTCIGSSAVDVAC